MLAPHVQAAVDRLVAEAPPLSAGQQRLLQAIFAPVVRDMADRAAREPQAA